MKIAVNSRIFESSETGISNYISNLYNTLLNIDKKNQYLFLQTKNNKSLGNTKFLNIKKNSYSGSLFDLFYINGLFKNEEIDMFHGPSHILPFFKKRKTKYLLTIHDLAFITNPKLYPFIFRIYYRYILRRSIKNADLIIAVSKNTRKDILKFYNLPSEKIKTIYSGINNIFFNKNKKKRLINDKYFFSVTTHPKRKNIYCLLEVFAKNNDLKNYKFVIAGCIPKIQLKEFEKKIKELKLKDRVIIFGYAKEDDLVNLYQNAEFFIYPSFYEGFGFPVLEAMACKCPVITSNNSSLIEITPEKKLLINPYDNIDISNKISNLINLSRNKKNQLILKNYNFSIKFKWEKTAKEYLKIFEILK